MSGEPGEGREASSAEGERSDGVRAFQGALPRLDADEANLAAELPQVAARGAETAERVTHLGAEFDDLRAEMHRVDARINELRGDLRAEMQEGRSQLRAEMQRVDATLNELRLSAQIIQLGRDIYGAVIDSAKEVPPKIAEWAIYSASKVAGKIASGIDYTLLRLRVPYSERRYASNLVAHYFPWTQRSIQHEGN